MKSTKSVLPPSTSALKGSSCDIVCPHRADKCKSLLISQP